MEDLPFTELPILPRHPKLHQPHLNLTRRTPSPALPQWNQTHISSLYPEILALIFSYLDVCDKGRAAQVCSAWREASYHKSVWRGVQAKLHLKKANTTLYNSLNRRGIRRVQVLSSKKSLRDVVQNINKLESLSLSGCFNVNDVALSHAFFTEVESLVHLDLSLCKQVTDISLKRICEYLKNLQTLELGGCSNITNNGLLAIARGLRRLRRLNLRSCWYVSDVGMSHIAGQSGEAEGNLELEHLGLQDCQRLSDDSLKYLLAGNSKLASINLSFCVSITDSGLKYLARMPSLRELNLRSCDNISDAGMSYLAEGGSRIAALDVSFCDKIGDQALSHISQGLFNLRSLSLSNCQISDDGVYKITRTLHDVDTLNIGQCSRITDKSLAMIAESFKNLQYIDLYGLPKISTLGLEKIMQLQQLKHLNIGLHDDKRPLLGNMLTKR